MNDIQVSIIVPVYNNEEHLAELFTSLLHQSGVMMEIIAVNDGSTDGSLTLLKNIAQHDKRVIICNQDNRGPAEARNSGIKLARGTWIAFADSDDWLAPDTLRLWHNLATELRVDVLIGNGFNFATRPQQATMLPLLTRQPWNEIITGKQWIIRSVAQNEWPHYAWLQLIRRELIIENNLAFIPSIAHEDILWTTRLALVAQRISFCVQPCYGYRVNPHSIMHSLSEESIFWRAESYLFIIKELVDIAAEHTQDAQLRKALLRQANRESGHLSGLIRKKINKRASRKKLANTFMQLHLGRAILRGATTFSELWRAIRCWYTFSCLQK